MTFDNKRGRFVFTFEHDSEVAAPTEIFVPRGQYPTSVHVEVTDGRYELDQEAQVLRYWYGPDRVTHTIRLERS
jgi:hypothetical protein